MKRNSQKTGSEGEGLVPRTLTLPRELLEFAAEESRKLPGAARENVSLYVRVLIERARGKKGKAA